MKLPPLKHALVGAAGLIAVLFLATRIDQSVVPQVGPSRDAAKLLIKGQMINFTLSDNLKPAPAVAFVDAGGAERTLADFQGKVVLVNLWATWCAPCLREMPALDRLNAKLGGDDFLVLALAQERKGLEAVKAFLDKHDIRSLAAYVDQPMNATRAFGAFGLPASVLLDREGSELGRLVGPAEWDSPEAVALMRHFIARRT